MARCQVERLMGTAGLRDVRGGRADLIAAFDDEHMSRATYAQVIAASGEVRPFSNVVEAEGRHVEALVRLFERYDVTVPADTWPGRVRRFPSLHKACLAGVAAEIDNAALHERLLVGTDRVDILAVYRNLQEASQERTTVRAEQAWVDRDRVEGSSTIGCICPGDMSPSLWRLKSGSS